MVDENKLHAHKIYGETMEALTLNCPVTCINLD